MVSFATILSQNGQTLHNHDHSQILQTGRLMLTDAGAESVTNCPFTMIDHPTWCHMNANINSMNYSLDDRWELARLLLHPIRGDFQ
jgi:hypothetical protein